jgi:hypothetical protein
MRIHLAGYILLASFSSCLTIIHPLITSDNIIIDSRIDGTWVSNDSKVILIQKIMNSELKLTAEDLQRKDYTFEDSLFYAKQYVISYQQKDLRYFWIAGLVKIKNQYYLNLTPVVCVNEKGNGEYDLGDATSSIAKLEWKGDNTLSVHFLNGDRIREIILSGKARIKHEHDPLFGTFVITASSKELEAFLEKYGDYDNLFTGGETIDLVRKN